MKYFKLLTLMMLLPVFAYGVTAPKWVQHGVGFLEKQRTNNTYTFQMFNTHGPFLQELKDDATNQLVNYVVRNCDAEDKNIEVEKAPSYSGMTTYLLKYTDRSGQKGTVTAVLVDEFDQLDDFEFNVYEYEFYQLYAISRPNVAPQFDKFEITKKYSADAVAKSLVPGLGQLYKGQPQKAYVIMGGEVLLLGATALFEYKRHDCAKMVKEQPSVEGSWKSKANGWRNFRNVAIGGAVALYIYNLIDAGIADGASQVVVKPGSYNVSVLPYAAPNEAGLSLNLTF